MCLKRDETISLSERALELVGMFTYLVNNILSTESDVDIRLAKVRNAIDKLLTPSHPEIFLREGPTSQLFLNFWRSGLRSGAAFLADKLL